MDAMKQHAGRKDKDEAEEVSEEKLSAYIKWKMFALKQEELYEKNLPTRSILAVENMDHSQEAWRELEIKVHESQTKMPVPILYEVEIAAGGSSGKLAPIFLRLLKEAAWPLHTSLKLIALCKMTQKRVAQTSAIWKGQAEILEQVSLEMLDQLDRPELLERIILCPRPRVCAPPKPLIQLAIDADHHPFLAHRTVQQMVLRKWLSPIRLDSESSPTYYFLTRLIFVLISWTILAVNKITFGALSDSLKTIQDRQRHPIIAHLTHPDSTQQYKEDYFSYSPKTSFQLYSAFYCAFAIIVSWAALTSSTNTFQFKEGLILVWVAGLWLLEVVQFTQLWLDYFSSFWNYFDIVHLFTYTAALAVKIAVHFLEKDSFNERRYLESYECILALAVFMTYMRGLYICRPFSHLGPLLVSFGHMITNVIWWFVIALIVVAALSLGMLKLFVPLSDNEPATTSASADADSVVSSTAANSSAAKGPEGVNFQGVFMSLLWGMTNMPMFDGSSYDTLNFESLTSGRKAFGQISVTLFMILVTIVLINLLIAIMNNTYSKVTDETGQEHKVEFVSIVEEFSDTPPMPSPLNLVAFTLLVLETIFFGILNKFPDCLCINTGRCLGWLHPRDTTSPWYKTSGRALCRSLNMHTQFFMPLRRLNAAMFGEAAVRDKLKPWLASLKPDTFATQDEDAIKIQQLSAEIEQLKHIIAKLSATPPSGRITARPPE
eukprot:m51a1_g9254 hypothetical protein (718) ;mRNA; f:28989-31455